jgi:predicted RNA-binding Zn ribbon-like protein
MTAPLPFPTSSPSLADVARAAAAASGIAFVGDRLWLDFVNSDEAWPAHGDPRAASRRAIGHDGGANRRCDALADFEGFVRWMECVGLLDGERAAGIRRRALQQPAGATAVLADARRVRASLRALAEWSAGVARGPADVRAAALAEINRVLGRSAGMRRLEQRPDGIYARSFAPVGDAFASLLIPVVDSAADALILGELARVRRCADPRCHRVFHDATKNGRRRWCDMAACGNRAKAARHRLKEKPPS